MGKYGAMIRNITAMVDQAKFCIRSTNIYAYGILL